MQNNLNNNTSKFGMHIIGFVEFSKRKIYNPLIFQKYIFFIDIFLLISKKL